MIFLIILLMFWLISLFLQFYFWRKNTLAAAGSCKTWFYLFLCSICWYGKSLTTFDYSLKLMSLKRENEIRLKVWYLCKLKDVVPKSLLLRNLLKARTWISSSSERCRGVARGHFKRCNIQVGTMLLFSRSFTTLNHMPCKHKISKFSSTVATAGLFFGHYFSN